MSTANPTNQTRKPSMLIRRTLLAAAIVLAIAAPVQATGNPHDNLCFATETKLLWGGVSAMPTGINLAAGSYSFTGTASDSYFGRQFITQNHEQYRILIAGTEIYGPTPDLPDMVQSTSVTFSGTVTTGGGPVLIKHEGHFTAGGRDSANSVIPSRLCFVKLPDPTTTLAPTTTTIAPTTTVMATTTTVAPTTTVTPTTLAPTTVPQATSTSTTLAPPTTAAPTTVAQPPVTPAPPAFPFVPRDPQTNLPIPPVPPTTPAPPITFLPLPTTTAAPVTTVPAPTTTAPSVVVIPTAPPATPLPGTPTFTG